MNLIKILQKNRKKRKLIDSMLTSGISREYETELELMTLEDVKREYTKFVSLMKH